MCCGSVVGHRLQEDTPPAAALLKQGHSNQLAFLPTAAGHRRADQQAARRAVGAAAGIAGGHDGARRSGGNAGGCTELWDSVQVVADPVQRLCHTLLRVYLSARGAPALCASPATQLQTNQNHPAAGFTLALTLLILCSWFPACSSMPSLSRRMTTQTTTCR